jgi:hypothetical protein
VSGTSRGRPFGYDEGSQHSFATTMVRPTAPQDVTDSKITYGTFQGGAHLIPAAWTRASHRFEVDDSLSKTKRSVPNRPKASDFSGSLDNAPSNVLAKWPVDVFVADHSRASTDNGTPLWYDWLHDVPKLDRPQVVVQVWPSYFINQEKGPMAPQRRKSLERLGYAVSFHFMKGLDYGGTVDQDRLVVMCISSGTASEGERVTLPKHETATPRPMANCLRPFGAGSHRETKPQLPNHVVVRNSVTDPMPPNAKSWIQTPKGFRRLHADELAKGLGMPSSWRCANPDQFQADTVDRMTAVHLWEVIGTCVHNVVATRPTTPTPVPSVSKTETLPTRGIPEDVPRNSTPPALLTKVSDNEWTWAPPLLAPNRPWYRRRIANLRKACSKYPVEERVELMQQGKNDLERHRNNYGPDGPTHLQLLWWEFPPEHWDDIRVGCSMNFLKEVERKLTPNAPADDDQLEAGGEFVDELIQLSAVEECPEDDPMVANAPLFIVPKPGQPGQWRVIADMKKGGQNQAIGRDPVYLPRVDTILPHMYTGGWSAVVDASKFFYQFKTLVSERKYLGLIHPITGKHYRYKGLPMGSANSPAVASKMGESFLRRLRQRCKDFQGEPVSNTWWEQFRTGDHESSFGHGRVLLKSTDDGVSPCSLIWVHVDDFLIHAATREQLVSSLNAFMDLAVVVGLLCNPVKVVPPAQCVKYCGFLYDSVAIPTLKIPEAKRSKALAVVEYCQSKRGKAFPRLCLAVVTGLLQSLVDATPSRIGQTFLRRLINALHGSEPEPGPYDPRRKYYTYVILDELAWADLEWWRLALSSSVCRPVRARKSGTLSTKFGDGSGTGTGGTNETYEGAATTPMEMWMGTWDAHVHHFTSNWKELCTLKLSMEQESKRASPRCKGATMFYFTDNEVTYHIVNGGSSREPRLQKLIHEIKALEILLQCHLVVIHVPGKLMIVQGTDDLSRGIWISPLRERIPTRQLLARIFAPVDLHPGWQQWCQYQFQLPVLPPTDIVCWDDEWNAEAVLNQMTVWTPPPEMASQAISHVLSAWVERPHTSSALFIVPRVMTRSWQYLSKHIQTLATIPTNSTPFISHPVPVIILYLPCYIRSLPPPPSDRLDKLTFSNEAMFSAAVEMLRGLS